MYDILDEISKFDNVIVIGDLNVRIGEYSSDAVRCSLKHLLKHGLRKSAVFCYQNERVYYSL